MTKESEKDQIERIKRAIRAAVGRTLSMVDIDEEDLKYTMTKALLRAHGLELIENDVYEDKIMVGRLESIDYDGKDFDVVIKRLNPFHYISVGIVLDDISVSKKNK